MINGPLNQNSDTTTAMNGERLNTTPSDQSKNTEATIKADFKKAFSTILNPNDSLNLNLANGILLRSKRALTRK